MLYLNLNLKKTIYGSESKMENYEILCGGRVHGKSIYESHTSSYKWHTNDIRVYKSDIQMAYDYIRVKYECETSKNEWHTNDIQVIRRWRFISVIEDITVFLDAWIIGWRKSRFKTKSSDYLGHKFYHLIIFIIFQCCK